MCNQTLGNWYYTSFEYLTAYRAAKNPVTRTQYQIIWLLASEKKTTEVAIAMGYTVEWVRELARRYMTSEF